MLGPLLFLIYINDLPAGINSEVTLFADDCRSIDYSSDVEVLLNKVVSWLILKYIKANQLASSDPEHR